MVRRTTVFTVVEQFWHPLPGGTARATEKTLKALISTGGGGEEFGLAGIAAYHRRGRRKRAVTHLPDSTPVAFHRLPRPVLYEGWVRWGYPKMRHPVPGPASSSDRAVVWAASGVVPATDHPVITTVHDLDFLRHPDRLTSRGRSFFPRMWQAALTSTEHFVCPSTVVAIDLAEQGVDRERISVVPWGVDRPACPAHDAEAICASLNLPDRFVLWVGPLLARKNPEGAAAAMAAVAEDLVVVGGGLASPNGEAAISRLGSRVHRLERVDDYQLSALYHRARALLYPSHDEGFGMPVLEAMIHRTPVVTSAGTATEELARQAALVVDPADHDGLARALVAAVNDEGLRERLVTDGYRRAAQLSWETTAEGYAEVFRKVADHD